jgi:hypothetical protein
MKMVTMAALRTRRATFSIAPVRSRRAARRFREVREIFDPALPRAAAKLVELIDAEGPRVGVAADNAVFDRMWGRTTVPIDASIRTGSIQYERLKALQEIQERLQQGLLELTAAEVKNWPRGCTFELCKVVLVFSSADVAG